MDCIYYLTPLTVLHSEQDAKLAVSGHADADRGNLCNICHELHTPRMISLQTVTVIASNQNSISVSQQVQHIDWGTFINNQNHFSGIRLFTKICVCIPTTTKTITN